MLLLIAVTLAARIAFAAALGLGLLGLLFLVFLLVWFAADVLVRRTAFGAEMILVGTSARVARFSGIATGRVISGTHLITALIASIAGLSGLPTSSAYVAAKHGVVGLTKTAALEYAEVNIRVNAVCPGYIRTRMTQPGMQLRGEAILAQTPFKRMGNPEEIAEMVLWLCSERASFVSGAAYNVDGGWMAT